MFIPTPRRGGLWDQPIIQIGQSAGAAAAAVGSVPTDPGCQGHPTVLLPAHGWVAATFDHYPGTACYPWDQAPPLWAGYARGLFRFNARAVPARTHGGLASQADIETRLGRSIVDPTDPDGEVYYWDEYPLLFGIRNESGETVTAEFARTGGCDVYTLTVLDGEELDVGPFYGDASHVLVQLSGATNAPGEAPTVPVGLDVRVTAPTIDDPGETFASFACARPYAALWDETFEGTGYVRTWDGGETATGTLDEDASSPGSAPTWWGSKALQVTVAAGETAFVQHGDVGFDQGARLTLGLYVDSEGLSDGEAVYVAIVREDGGDDLVTFFVQQSGGQLQLTTTVKGSNSESNRQTDIAVQTFYLIEFEWDQDAETWELYIDETLEDSGTITEGPLTNDYRMRELVLGCAAAADAAIDYYVGRFSLTTIRPPFLD